MGWFENLKNLIDFNIGDISLVDITIVKVSGEGQQPPLRVSDDNQLTVDVEAIDEEKRSEAMDYVTDAYSEEGEILKDTASDKKKAIESADRVEIEETLEFFRPKISNRYVKILEASLYLRETLEDDQYVPRNKVEAMKRDIAEKYGTESYYVINLCSAGYFDEGRYFRELYHQMAESDEWKEGDYQDVFGEIIENEPFTVFVSTDQDAYEVKNSVKTKLAKYQRYSVDISFVDVRGIGQRNHEIARGAVERLEEELGDFDYNENIRDNEIVIRIRPDTVSGLDA